MPTIKYSKLAIFNKEPNTADKDPYWTDFKKAQTKTYKCRDCAKVLISRQKIDLDPGDVGSARLEPWFHGRIPLDLRSLHSFAPAPESSPWPGAARNPLSPAGAARSRSA